MFPKPSFEEWKSQVMAELKGKDFDQTLVWQSPDGIPVQPMYMDVPQELRAPISLPRTGWEIIEPVTVTDAVLANQIALDGLKGGATSVFFDIRDESISPAILFRDILLDVAPVYLKGATASEQWKEWLTAHHGTLVTPLTHLLEEVNKGEISEAGLHELPSFSIHLMVDAAIFKECGGSIIHEVGYAISALQEQLHIISRDEKKLKDVREVVILNAVGNNYFFEMAKIRAIRQLAEKVIAMYGNIPLKIISSSAQIHISHTDRHTNVLRLTTAAMSAVLGKSDGVILHPYEENRLTRRITRNIHHLLIEESHFHHMNDPAAGSYYISHLTKAIMEAAWSLFLETENDGGYIQSMEKGRIRQTISLHREQLEKDIAFRRNILLGVNQYPSLDEIPAAVTDKNTVVSEKGLQPIRLAEPFERLRLRTEHFVAVGHHRPLALLLKFGNPSVSAARATWSLNFLACAGIASKESSADFDTVRHEIESGGAQIVVFCSDNDSWSSLLPEYISRIPDGIIKVLAGKGDFREIDFIIYEGCNALVTLEQLVQQLGIH